MNSIENFFGYLGVFLLIINACLYIWSYRTHKGSVALKYFTVYLVSICVIQIIGYIYSYHKENNLYLSHYYFIIQFIFMSLFYKELFLKTQKKIVNYLLIGVLITLTIQYCIKPELYVQFNILEIFITTVPLIIYSIIFLYNSLSKPSKYVYINAAVLIYLTTSTLIYILGDYLSVFLDDQEVKGIWLINRVLYVIYVILILIEWKQNLQPKNK